MRPHPRLLSFLFKSYQDFTISILTGFVAGSLAIIWPWKETQYMTLEGGKEKAIGYEWQLPAMGAEFFIAIALMILGFLLVWLMERYANKDQSAI